MAEKIIWDVNSPNPENSANLDAIAQWWMDLNDNEIIFAQRLIPETGQASEMNWESQRFDERSLVQQPRVGGITLYWRKPDAEEERSLTPAKLELNRDRQELYIYSQAQRNLVIRVTKCEEVYQTYTLSDPQIAGAEMRDRYILLFRDADQKIEVKLTLDRQSVEKLNRILTPTDRSAISLDKQDS
jgi:hypothetical protein